MMDDVEQLTSVGNTAAEQFILDLYRHLLRRDPQEKERSHWVNALKNGMPEHAVFSRFINSSEYKEKSRVRCAFPDGHFHSPIVDPSQVADYIAGASRSMALLQSGDLPGIALNEKRMVAFWNENGDFIAQTPFTEGPSADNRYYYDNRVFPYGDAIILRAMIGAFRPKKIIEVGSGYSSACILDSAEHFGIDELKLTCIEPYPSRLKGLLRPGDLHRVTIIERPVQTCPATEFEGLQPNDVLFIDSTHVMKTGSDVHHELFNILPALVPGTLIHFHDIQYPFEYPDDWIQKNFSWNEIYALRAFLMYNPDFEIIFFNSMFAHKQSALIRATFPLFLRNPGGSLWLRKNIGGSL
jgi:predicted O-methyltransferase YrrM